MSNLVSIYEKLLLDNVATVRSIESGIRNLTWLLPGRFEDAEVASEACESPSYIMCHVLSCPVFRDRSPMLMPSVYALSSIVSSYHDTLLHRRISNSLSLPPHPFTTSSSPPPGSNEPSAPSIKRVIPALPPPSDHARYTRYWTDRSGVYRRASRALSTLGYLQLLMEMVARRRGNDKIRWRVVLVTEAVK